MLSIVMSLFFLVSCSTVVLCVIISCTTELLALLKMCYKIWFAFKYCKDSFILKKLYKLLNALYWYEESDIALFFTSCWNTSLEVLFLIEEEDFYCICSVMNGWGGKSWKKLFLVVECPYKDLK